MQSNAQPERKMKTKNMTTLPIGNSISPECFRGYLLIALAWFALSPTVQAVSPPPDGGYAGANTAEGTNALLSLTSGINNTAVGFGALLKDTTGSHNVGVGSNALGLNTSGSFNMAIGTQALYNNTASANLAIGFRVLYFNTTGNNLTGVGAGALYKNTTGSFNTAVGAAALNSNTTGIDNTANGGQALFNNTTGFNNTANGAGALYSNTNGNFNTANGVAALSSNATGGGNIALGFAAGDNLTTGSNNIDIGNYGVAGEAAKIRIGTGGTQTAAFIAGISGATVTGTAVVVNSSGQLGVAPSSVRFKDEIKPMDKASEAILALQPVTFRYKRELDPAGIPQFGLVAEQVEKVNPDLVARDSDGKPYTVRYEAVNAMLLNEFLKEHRKVDEQDRRVQEQEATITQLKSTVAQQQKDFQAAAAHQQEQIKALTAGFQRVSAQVEMSRPAPQMALNNQ